jgi:molybdopterin-containing oxidoreductase family membrane subunit
MNNKRFLALTGVLLGVTLIGLYAAIVSLTTSHAEVLGTTRLVPWGILISTYVFFAVSGTGLCLISSFGHVFGIRNYKLIGKRGVFLAIVMLLVGFVVIALDLENPFILPVYFILSPNLSSAIWWMGFLYSVYLAFLVAELWFMNKERWMMAKTAGAAAVIAGISATSVLGAVFGLVKARPFWYGAYMPLFFILTALVSGAAILVLAIVVTQWVARKELDDETRDLTMSLGKLLGLLLGATLFFVAWKVIISTYLTTGEYLSTKALVFGPLSMRFWVIHVLMGMLIPFLILLYPRTRTLKGVFAASVLVILSMFVVRYDWVLAGQLVPVLGGAYAAYAPTAIEKMIVAGALAAAALFYTLGERYLYLSTPKAEEA